MRSRLIVDGNEVYEVDEDCMRKRRSDKSMRNVALENDKEDVGKEETSPDSRKKR